MKIEFSDKLPIINYKYVDKDLYKKINILKTKIDSITDKNEIKRLDYTIKMCNNYEQVPYIDKIKRISRAFYKLYEIDNSLNIIPKTKTNIVSCHLCESPGGFVECVKEKRYYHDDVFIAQSLYKSDCKFSKKIKNYCKILHGYDKSGDILKKDNILEFVNYVNQFGKADFITCDGGFDVSSDYTKQEQLSFKLIYCQILTSVMCLKNGGNLICKIFDMYTLPTIQFIYIISQMFENMNIIKPLMSRPCNSEKYIIFQNFKGVKQSFIDTLFENIKDRNIKTFNIKIDHSFEKRIKNINNNFLFKQIKSFEIVFLLFNNYEKINRKDLIQSISNEYLHLLYG